VLDEVPPKGAKVRTLRRKKCSEEFFASLAFVLVSVCGRCFFPGSARPRVPVAFHAPHPPASQVLIVVPVLLSQFSDDILNSVQPSPSRATTLAFSTKCKAGKLAVLS
jgi:hypothetical protein